MFDINWQVNQSVIVQTGKYAGEHGHFLKYGKEPNTAVVKLRKYPKPILFKTSEIL